MEVVLSTSGEFSGLPAPPYWKVAFAGDHAEVAEIACDDRTEMLVLHADLEARLRENYPELAGGGFFSEEIRFLAGWLTAEADEAVLRLQVTADGLTEDDAGRVGRAMSEWCQSRGIRRLTFADISRRSGTAAPPDPDAWNMP
jgi:hypothetical protein